MDRWETRRRIAQRPNAVRFAELQQLLEAYGWGLSRITGSHHIFARGGDRLPIPFKRPHVLAVYVHRVLKATEGEDHGDDD